MTIHHQADGITLLTGDALQIAQSMESGSVDCIVTSPPYYGLRDYGQPGQYGLEESPAAYVETMRALFSELRRVLSDTGTLWLNLGDSYSFGSTPLHNRNAPNKNTTGSKDNASAAIAASLAKRQQNSGLPAKSMLGVPWRVAFALQDDGWLLRNDIIWEKPNAMPQSATDRLSTRYEHIFLLTKGKKYHFDLDEIRVPVTTKYTGKQGDYDGVFAPNPKGKNPGDVWRINNKGFPEAHFATFPVELPRRCLAAGCKPGGVVLDPFSGSGTTGLAARGLGLDYIGIDINPEYHDLALRTRLAT